MPRAFLFLLLLLFSSVVSHSQNQAVYEELLKQLPAQSGINKAVILNKLAKEIRSNNTDSALAMVDLAMSIAKEYNNDSTIAESYANLGVIHLYKGNSDKAISCGREAIKIFKKINNMARAADGYNNIGVVYRRMGDYKMALGNYLQALRIKEKLDSKPAVIAALNNIGGVYYYQKNYPKALQYYTRVLAISEELKDDVGAAAAYSNLSLLAYEQEDYEKAIFYNDKSISIRKKLNDMLGMAKDLNNSGRIYIKTGDTQKAIINFLHAIEKYKKIGDMNGASNSLFNLGEIYLSEKNHENAKRFFMQSLLIAEELNILPQIRDNYGQLAECELKAGNPLLAYKYLADYVSINDSLINQENVRQVAEMEAQYQTETKEKEIELLKKDKELQFNKLAKSNAEAKNQQIQKIAFATGFGLILIMGSLGFKNYRQKQKDHKKLAEQKSIIEEKNKDITDSIKYAKRIQEAILPPDKVWKDIIPNSFVYYKPKDILSGDFYWIEKNDNSILVAAVDCTGHGVPGALMSIVGYNLLNKAVLEQGLTKPSEILDQVNKWLTISLRQTIDDSSVRDGMDIALVSFPITSAAKNSDDKCTLQFAGAFNSLYHISGNTFNEIKGDKFPVGIFINEAMRTFNNNEINILPGDMIYLFSDGFSDQFGGNDGKKFRTGNFKKLLLSIHEKSMNDQKEILNETFETWKGNLEQVDDVCVIGVRI